MSEISMTMFFECLSAFVGVFLVFAVIFFLIYAMFKLFNFWVSSRFTKADKILSKRLDDIEFRFNELTKGEQNESD